MTNTKGTPMTADDIKKIDALYKKATTSAVGGAHLAAMETFRRVIVREWPKVRDALIKAPQ